MGNKNKTGKKCYVWVKNLATQKSYAISSHLLYHWNGRENETQLPFDPKATFKAGNDYCVYIHGSIVRHAAYHAADTRELCQSLTKSVGGKDLRKSVVPKRKSLTPNELPSTSSNAKTEIVRLKHNEERKLKRQKDVTQQGLAPSSPPLQVVSPTKSNGTGLKWLKQQEQCHSEDDEKVKQKKSKKQNSSSNVSRFSHLSEDFVNDGFTEDGTMSSHLGSGKKRLSSEAESGGGKQTKFGESADKSEDEDVKIHFSCENDKTSSMDSASDDNSGYGKDAISQTPKTNDTKGAASRFDSRMHTPGEKSRNQEQTKTPGDDSNKPNMGEASLTISSQENHATKNCGCGDSNKGLLKRLDALEKTVSSQTSTIQKVYDLVSRMYKAQRKCPISELERAVDGFDDIEVPDDCVLAGELNGSQLFIRKDAIVKVEKDYTSLKSRILALGQLFYGVDYYLYSHIGTKDKKRTLQCKIEADHVSSMSKILHCLRWSKAEDLSSSTIGRMMGKYFSEVRKIKEKEEEEKLLCNFQSAQLQGKTSPDENHKKERPDQNRKVTEGENSGEDSHSDTSASEIS